MVLPGHYMGWKEANVEHATIRESNADLMAVDDPQANILDLGKNECAAIAIK